MDWANQLTHIQVDVTSYCNAKCGGCARNIYGGEKQPWLELNHLDKQLWYRIFTEDTINKEIAHLKLNGNWGDAGMHPDLPEMIKVFGMCNKNAGVQICTNGGTHNTEWWASLGEALARNTKYHTVDFAIDGLEDTHSIYRRSTDYNKILQNAISFAEAGGNSRWIMTLFDHNIHQIEEAIQEAKNNKFASIKFRYSHSKNSKVKTSTEDYILHTDKADKVSLPKTVYFKDANMFNNIEENINESKCPWNQQRRIQIGPWGNVWPCCYVADVMEGLDNFDQREQIYNDIIDPDWNNLAKHTLDDILNHEWFTDILDKAVEHGKYDVCKDKCGI